MNTLSIKKLCLIVGFVAGLFALNSGVWAQLTLRLHTPPPNKLGIKEWWKLDVINSGSSPITAILRGEIKRVTDNNVIFSAETEPITFNPGVDRLTLPKLPVKKSSVFLEKSYKKALSRNQLPKGLYLACVYALQPETRRVLASNCISFSSIPLTAPKLLKPIKNDTVVLRYPIFTWTYPPQPGYTIRFDLKIVEVMPYQTPEQAIESNPPIHEAILSTNFYVYPARARKLEKGKRYAWKVTMKVTGGDLWGEKIIESPVESFIYNPN